MDMDLFRGLITVLLLGLFVALWIWAWSRRRHAEYEAAAQLPLEDDERPPESTSREQKQ